MKIIFFCKAAIVFIYSLSSYVVNAQVCNGSLGDPVVNVNFGNGTNPGNQLKAATTTYNFTSSTCPNDGFYTVVNNTAGCFNNSWHTVTEDHTPNDVNGYMMLVNASFNPGDFYVDTVRNLCANTTYEFAAWVSNVLLSTSCGPNPISPKLIFNVETITGTVLGTYSTGDISTSGSPTWKQYGLFFTTPINSNDVVIRLTNTAPGGCGNDIALDDITFRPCGPTVTISAGNNPSPNYDICTGIVSTLPLNASIGNGYISPSLQWQESLDNGNTWIDITGQTSVAYLFNQTATGVYKYRLSVAEGTNISISNCRVASNPITITIRDIPVVVVMGNSPVCEKSAVNLTATGGSTYAWTGPAGFSSTLASPSFPAKNNSAGVYNVNVTDQYGCKNTATVTLIVNPKPLVTISSSQKICEGDSVMLQAGGGSTFLWSPATTLSATNIANPIARPVDTTIYSVIVANTINCMDTATVSVNVLKKPTAFAGPDKILLKGQQVVLEGKAGGSNISINWTPANYLDNPLLAQPTAAPLNDILYTLTVTSNAGCGMATDDVFVKVYNDIYVPAAFSPNNDRLNDTWKIEALVAVPNAKVMVYNRYGIIIFETTGNSKQWDGSFKGKALPTGAYPYMIDLKNGRPLKTGMVMIVR